MALANGTRWLRSALLAALALLCCVVLAMPVAHADEGESASASAASASASAQSATSVDGAAENLVDPTQRADNSFIYDTTISSLFEQASLYEGKTVQFTGEVIGDRINAQSQPGHCWIMMTSTYENESSSITVLLSDEQANQIDRYGRYGVVGTTFQVRGVYHQACSEHDGMPDVHATNSAVIARGSDHPDKFSAGAFVPGAIAVVIGFVLMGVFYFARERMR